MIYDLYENTTIEITSARTKQVVKCTKVQMLNPQGPMINKIDLAYFYLSNRIKKLIEKGKQRKKAKQKRVTNMKTMIMKML